MQTRSFGRFRVAVIDDDVHLRDLLVRNLNRRGFQAEAVSETKRVAEAVALYGAHIVLCDIRMPGTNGLTVARRLKAQDPATQVILMTAFPDQDTVDEAFRLGADDYLIKPFGTLKSVQEAVDKAARRLREHQKATAAAVKRDFPEEYWIIYRSGGALPSDEELERLLSEVGDAPPPPPPSLV